jgi:hypothetical protein
MAHLRLLVANADNATETVLIEINGGNDWVKEVSTGIHGFFDAMKRHVPFEFTEMDIAEYELREAFAMAAAGDSYAGKIVTTSIDLERGEARRG